MMVIEHTSTDSAKAYHNMSSLHDFTGRGFDLFYHVIINTVKWTNFALNFNTKSLTFSELEFICDSRVT